MSDTTKPECGTAGFAMGVATGAVVGGVAVTGAGVIASTAPSYKATPVPAPAVLHATAQLSADALLPPPAPASVSAVDALAVCRALERPLEALSSLIGAVAGHPYHSDDLRALLERVGKQAAALQALVQCALAANASTSAAGSTATSMATATTVPTAAATATPTPRSALRKLTEREHEVLALLADGLATGEIAHRLGITSATVRSHIQNILTRLGVCNRRQAAALLNGRLSSPTRARLRAARRVPDAPRRPADLDDADLPCPQLIRLSAASAPVKRNATALPQRNGIAPPQKKPQKNTSTVPNIRSGTTPRSTIGKEAVVSTVARLTRREVQVLRCLAAGLGRSEIAERLYVSPHTARTHIQRVLTKLGVHSALAAMAVARDVGLAPTV